ncbi:MAG: pyrophosphatase [Alphaproteobacteria bacterium]|nr:pyrophosphatase [Alphaproteobacteria bacterium]
MAISLEKYTQFVDATASDSSKNYPDFSQRLSDLDQKGFATQRVMNAAIGMCAESGEFMEIVKKIVFQGKEPSEENMYHLKRELGDIIWYIAQACIGLNISLSDVIQMNFDKLSARYPQGFSIERSEYRPHSDV